jgi:hypothetical protein
MIGRRCPGLLPAWDEASYILADQQIKDADPWAIAETLEPLCTFLEYPEAAKLRKFRPFHVEI